MEQVPTVGLDRPPEWLVVEPITRDPDESHRLARDRLVGVGREERGCLHDVFHRERPAVERGAETVGVRDPLTRRQAREAALPELLQVRRREREAEVAGRLDVRKDPVGAGGAEGEVPLLLGEEGARLFRVLPGLVARTDRNLPGLVRVAGGADRQVARLLQVEPRVAVALHLRLDERDPRLVEERVERGLHVLPRGGGLRAEEVVGRRVPEAMLRQVVVKAALEDVRPDPTLEHRKDAAPLLVRDRVEGVLDVVRRFDRLPNRARARQGVGPHRPLDAVEELHLPGVHRIPGVRRFARDPGGERLVEPDVVPPGGGHEIADPLVRELVRHHARVAALLPERGRLLVEEKEAVGERHRAGVLHRAPLVRDRDDVELVVRVLDPEELLEHREDLAGVRERVRDLLPVPLHGHAAERERALADGVRRHIEGGDDVERPDRKRDQVAREREGRREVDAERAGFGPPVDLLRVRDRLGVDRNDERRFERDLEAGLVEAGEGVAGGDRLELRERVRNAPLGHLVEPLELGPERRVVLDVKLRFPGRERLRERERHHPGVIALEPCPLDLGSPFGDRRHARRVEAFTVEPHHAPRLVERDRDLDHAREALLLRVDVELEALRGRARVVRESDLRDAFAARRCGGRGGGHRRRRGGRRRSDGRRRGTASGRQRRERSEGGESERESGPSGFHARQHTSKTRRFSLSTTASREAAAPPRASALSGRGLEAAPHPRLRAF